MTEDCKLGFHLGLDNQDIDRDDELDVAVANVLKDYGIEKLARVDRYESSFDDSDFGAADRGGSFDDGSAF